MATRNILLNADMTCKISDFGLSRDLQDEMYYESEGGMVPVRWTPPEVSTFFHVVNTNRHSNTVSTQQLLMSGATASRFTR